MKSLLATVVVLATAYTACADLILTVDAPTGEMAIRSDSDLAMVSNMEITSVGGFLGTGGNPTPFPSASFTSHAAYYNDFTMTLTLNAGQSYPLDLKTSQSPVTLDDLSFAAEAAFVGVPTRIEIIPEPAALTLLCMGGLTLARRPGKA